MLKKPYVIYDSAKQHWICSGCNKWISIGSDQVVYGVGSAKYIRVFHRKCAEVMERYRAVLKEDK
jgi:hypothetical protein